MRIQRVDRVVIATLTNPPHALMTMDMMNELGDHVREWENDDSVGAVVLTGAHPERFLAHFDVADLLEGATDVPTLPARAIRAALATVDNASRLSQVEGLLARSQLAGLVELINFQRTLVAMGRSGVAYLAAINGSAMGGGCELALSCDFRFMADGEFLIGQPELGLGFPPGGGGTQRLARLLGEAKALELTLDPSPRTPAEAEAIGLVTTVVPGDRLLDEAVEAAKRLSRMSKAGVRATKRAIRDGGSQSLEQGLRIEAANFMAAITTDEARRLMQAYVDRTAELGDVPAYDRASREEIVDGTFVDLYG